MNMFGEKESNFPVFLGGEMPPTLLKWMATHLSQPAYPNMCSSLIIVN